MHPTIWKASGHVDAFNDPMIDNKDSKKRYRADVLREDHMAKYADKIEKEVAKGIKKFGDDFDEVQFRATNPNVKRAQDRIDSVEARMKSALDANDPAALRNACSTDLPALRAQLRTLVHYHLGSPPLRTRQLMLDLRRLLDAAPPPVPNPTPP